MLQTKLTTMKKLLTGLFLLTCFIACKNAADENKKSADVANSNADKTKMVYHALETGDTKGLDSIFSDDCIDHDAGPNGEDIKGKQNVIADIAKAHNMFNGLKMEMLSHATSPDGDYHYSLVKMTGNTKDNSMGMPAGTKIESTGVDVIKIKDGKCTEHWHFLGQKDVNDMAKNMMGGGQPPMDSSKMKK
jgi:ketosteroid isomerase-like protein